jgi:hypothetical protein
MMGVEIKKREYTSMFRPQDTNVNWLLGNTGEWQKLTLEAEFGVKIEFDTTNTLFVDEPDQLTLTNGKSWNEYGFAEGDYIFLQWTHRDISNPSSPVDTFNRIPFPGDLIVMDRINDNKAWLVDSITMLPISGVGASSQILPINSGTFNIIDVSIYVFKRPQGIQLNYGHLENSNSASNNLTSFIDGTLTEFLVENTDTMAVNDVLPMQPLGNQSGMSVATAKLTYLGLTDYNIKHVYRIEIVFMLSSFFEDITNLEDRIAPGTVFDAASLTDNFEVIGFPVYNNPNIQIKNEMSSTDKLGNTGWFDENYNGLENDFVISSISYQKHDNLSTPAGGITVTQLDYQDNIKVTAVIDRVLNLTGQTKFQFGFAWIPLEDSEFRQNEYPFYKNLKMNTGGQINDFEDAFNVSNAYRFTPSSLPLNKAFGYSKDAATMDVQWLRASITGADQLTFEATFEPNSGFAALMDSLDETERNYVLWISVADQSLVTNFSNRVSLLLDYNQMESFIPPVGPYPGMTIEFLDHPQDENSVASVCGNDNRIEDDLLARVFYTIDTAVGVDIPEVTATSYGFIVQRNSDELTYELDNYQIDLTQFPDPTQFNFDASRGFKLGAGNNKNFIKVDYFPALDTGTEKGVRGLYGYKIRWEDWIKRLNVPAEIELDFYNNAELNNGINNDWFQWLSNAGYTLSFVVYTDAILNGNIVRYINTKPLPFVDYDDNADITSVVSYYRDSDNTLLVGGIDPITGGALGVILNSDIVRIEIEYTRAVGTWVSLANIYGLNTIEVDGGAGQLEYRQLSSVWLPEISNPLLPIAGGTLLDVQIINPTTLRCTCLVDPTKLINATRYKITGREGCK